MDLPSSVIVFAPVTNVGQVPTGFGRFASGGRSPPGGRPPLPPLPPLPLPPVPPEPVGAVGPQCSASRPARTDANFHLTFAIVVSPDAPAVDYVALSRHPFLRNGDL